MELRRARDVAGRRQADVAEEMDWSPSKLIRIERGDVGVSTNDLRALLHYYRVTDSEKVAELLELARSARGPSFYDQYAALLKPGFKEYLAYERSASVIRQYDPLLVPGLLQTEEYARALFDGMGSFGKEQADRLWGLRQSRQEVHERDSPPYMNFVVDEAALRRQVGLGGRMVHQLEWLKELAERRHIDVRVMPFSQGAHPGLEGGFILLEFADPNLDDLLHLETVNQTTIRDDTELIVRYHERFEQLQELALTPEHSVDFIAVLISDMSSTF